MIQFNRPTNLNGAELLKELKAIGISVKDLPSIDENGDFWLDIADKDKDNAAEVVANHDGTTIAPEPTVADKLASVGLSIEDLKAALLA